MAKKNKKNHEEEALIQQDETLPDIEVEIPKTLSRRVQLGAPSSILDRSDVPASGRKREEGQTFWHLTSVQLTEHNIERKQ